MASYESLDSCGLEWKRSNCKVGEEEVPGDEDLLDIDSLEILLHCKAGWTHETNGADRLVMSDWRNLKAK